MYIDYFKIFIAGACILTTAPFYNGFHSLKSQYQMENMKKVRIIGDTDPYYLYTLVAPMYFGTMSVLTLLVSNMLKINLRLCFIITSIISTINVSLFIKVNDVYTFDKKRWLLQYFYLLIYHMFIYNVVIVNIYYLLKK